MLELNKQINVYNALINLNFSDLNNPATDQATKTVINFSRIINEIGFRISKEELKQALSKLKFNITDTSNLGLGGIAHLIIYRNIPYKNNMNDKVTPEDAKKIAIELFLKNGLDPNLKDNYGYTFIEAAFMGVSEFCGVRVNNTNFIIKLIELAKEYGFNVNTKDNNGNTIIHTVIGNLDWYHEDILRILKALGPNFNINARNNDGQNIIEYLDYCINEANPLNDYNDPLWEENEMKVQNWKCRLSSQREQIVDYIQTMNNPLATNPATRETFLSALTNLKNLNKINIRLEAFQGEPEREIAIDKSIIDMFTIERLTELEKEKHISNIRYVTALVNNFFGTFFANEIINFILFGKEPLVISFYHIGTKINKPYPSDEPLIEKIKWLHEVLFTTPQRTIGPIIPKERKPKK